MRAVIMGCGRVGSQVAIRLCEEGHEVAVIDHDPTQFTRFLPASFTGQQLAGSGSDHRVLLEAGIERADAFMALTHGDNRNVLASQIAKYIYGVDRIVTRLADPFRAELFQRLGLTTVSPTNIGAELAYDALTRE
ncbi:MAG: TrkA family potassium uptake protein [Dehalococcoidia bacterium]|nr:TrkA family potassium uptake protein [Dehalococcoidia bacterium]